MISRASGLLVLLGVGLACANKVPGAEVAVEVNCARDLAVEATCTGSVDGGSAETLVTAFVVSPRGVPSGSSVVTIATPVGKALMIAKLSLIHI